MLALEDFETKMDQVSSGQFTNSWMDQIYQMFSSQFGAIEGPISPALQDQDKKCDSLTNSTSCQDQE